MKKNSSKEFLGSVQTLQNSESILWTLDKETVDKEITSPEETKKDEKKTATQKAEGSQENLKDQK